MSSLSSRCRGCGGKNWQKFGWLLEVQTAFRGEASTSRTEDDA